MYVFLQMSASQLGERTAWLLLHATVATMKLLVCNLCSNSKRRRVRGKFHSEDAKCDGVHHPAACPNQCALIGNVRAHELSYERLCIKPKYLS